MPHPLIQIWNKLSPKAQKFYEIFWRNKTGHRFTDSENFKFILPSFGEDAAHMGMLWKRGFDPEKQS